MFVSKVELDAMKEKQKQQDQAIDSLFTLLMQQEKEIQELKKPKEPNYMG